MNNTDNKKRIKKQRLLGVLFAVFMLIMMLPYISHGRAGVIVYAADEKLEIVGNPTVYVQSGGQTVFSIQVKNISGAELKGVNYYQGFRSMEQLNESGYVDGCSTYNTITYTDAEDSDEWFRFAPYFEKDKNAVNATWDSDEDGYTIGAGKTATIWLRVNSYYENPGTYNDWIMLGNTHTDYVGGFYPVTIVDEAYTGQIPIKVVTYNPPKAAITLGTSTTYGRTINTIALGSTIDFGTIDISKSTNLSKDKTIYTRNTSDYSNGVDNHGNSSDIKVELSVDTTNTNWEIESPFGCNSFLMNGTSWSPLPAAPLDAASWQQAQTGITINASQFVAGTYTAKFRLATTPHGVKVNGGSVNNKGVYTWPVSVTLTGTNPRIPKAPKNVSAIPGNGQVELTWDAADGAEDGQDYTVWRREGAETNAAAIDTAAFDWNKYEYVGNTVPKANGDYLFVDGTVQNGKSYTYAVIGGSLLQAYPAISSKVTPQSSIASKLQAPEDLSAMFTAGGIRFSWEMNENYGGDKNDGSTMVDHFNVYRDGVLVMQVNQNAVQATPNYYYEWEPVPDDPYSTMQVKKVKFTYEWETVVDAPTANQYYTLNVAAVSKSGVEGYWSEDVEYYSVPTNYEIVEYNASVRSYPDDNDNEIIYASLGIAVGEDSYAPEKVEFWRAEGTNAPDTSKTPYHVNRGENSDVRMFDDEPLQAGKTYTYTVRATDRDGNVSNDVTFTIKVPSGTDYYYADYSPQDVTWKVIDGRKAQMKFYPDYEYDDYGRMNYIGTYKVYRNNELKKTYSPSGQTSGTIIYEDTPTADGTYTYRVDRIVNGITVRGKDYIFTRNTAAVSTDSLLKAPSAPLFNVRISEGRPVLQWAPSNDDEEIDGYYIYRKDAGEYVNGQYNDSYYWGTRNWNNMRYIVVDKSVTGLTDESGSFMGDPEKGELQGVNWGEDVCPHEYWITAYNRVGESVPSQVFSFEYLGIDPETGEPIIPTNNDDYKPGTPTINKLWVEWEDDSQDSSSGIWDEAIGGNIHFSWTDAANSIGSIDEWEATFTGTHYGTDKDTVYAYQVMQYPAIKDGTDGYSPKSYVDADIATEYSGDYGRTATVKIAAKNSAGKSTSMGKTITIRSLPRFRVKPDDGAVQLEWTDLFNDDTTVVNKWEMWRKGEIGSWEKLATLNASGLSYAEETDSNGVQNYMWRDETAENGWNYEYKVVAKCADDHDRESVVRTAKPTLGATAVAPGSVRNLRATKNSSGEIIFTWDAPATGKAQHYQLLFEQEFNNGDKQWVESSNVDATANTIVWSYDKAGTYRFAVWAYSHIGGQDLPQGVYAYESDNLYELFPSASNIVTVNLTEADINAQASSYPGATKLSAVGGENKIDLSWTRAEGASYYLITRQNMDEDEDPVDIMINGDTLSYTDSNVIPGIEYRYLIYPYNSFGCSAYDDAYARATGRTKDQAIAEHVADLIEDLPPADNISAQNYHTYEAAANEAKAALDALTDRQRNQISSELRRKLTDLLDKISITKLNAQYAGAVAPVQEGINALPAADAITLGNLESVRTQVDGVRAAYNAITPNEAKQIVTTAKLIAAENRIAELNRMIADAAAVEEILNALTNIENLDDTERVEAARAAYDALSDEQKALIGSDALDKLTAAEGTIEELAAAEKKRIEKERADSAAANAVINMINNLPNQPGWDDKDAVEAARTAYGQLTDDQEALVGDEIRSKLEVVEGIIETIAKNAETAENAKKNINDLLDNINNLDPDDPDYGDAIEEAINLYNGLTEDQKEYFDQDTLDRLNDARDTYINENEDIQVPEIVTPNCVAHKLSAWATVKNATCAGAGLKERHCLNKGCDYKEQAAINAIGHTWRSSSATSYYVDYYRVTRTDKCSRCGAVKTSYKNTYYKKGLAGLKISKPKAGKKKLTAKWKKLAKKAQKNVSGIEIQVQGPGMSKIFTVGRGKASKSIKVPKAKSVYKVRVRTYKGSGIHKQVSNWSAWKSVKVK